MTQVQFNFEEVKIPLLGEDALFRGLATLDSASEDDSEFYVSLVQIGDLSLRRPSRINSANAVGDFLFTEIVKQIEDDKTAVGGQAAQEWAAVVEDQSFLARRFSRIPEISPTRSYAMEAAE